MYWCVSVFVCGGRCVGMSGHVFVIVFCLDVYVDRYNELCWYVGMCVVVWLLM